MRSIFIAYGNMFAMMRPVEKLTYDRMAPILLMHIIRFGWNLIALAFIIVVIWNSSFGILTRQVYLTIFACQVFITGKKILLTL